MHFVTISDHNCINGALEIAHLPGTFVSNEITAYFPGRRLQDPRAVLEHHGAQFDDIQRLRREHRRAARLLPRRGHRRTRARIRCIDINDRLTIDHFEQLLLLFNVFETMNGARNRRGNELVAAILRGLTREQFERMADRHGISPVGDRPWVKGVHRRIGRSLGDLHREGIHRMPGLREPGGVSAARRLSATSVAGGLDGTPLSFAHSLYSIGYQVLSRQVLRDVGWRRRPDGESPARGVRTVAGAGRLPGSRRRTTPTG